MKQILLWILLFTSYSINAQLSYIEGRTVDQNGVDGIEYATISAYSATDSILLEGTISDTNGNFKLSVNQSIDVYVEAQFLGYELYRSQTFRPTRQHVLEDILLQLSATTLQEIEISGKSIKEMHTLDKQVFDAGQYGQAKGGSAIDVLSNLPSVNVNSFGEISVRGATGFMVMLNGRPVQTDPLIILQQISANSIEDIELITAPSAKYDPDGQAGIINIKTKQVLNDGMYLSANVMVGLPSIEDYDNKNSTPRYGADLAINIKSGVWDIAGALDYRRYDISGRREGYVNTLINNELTEFPSDGERSFDEENYTARLSTVYRPNSNQSISAKFLAGKRTKERTADIIYTNQTRQTIPADEVLSPINYYNLYKEQGQLFSGGSNPRSFTFYNDNLRVRKGDFLIGSIDYSFIFNDKSAVTISGLYERTILGGPTDNVNYNPELSQVYELQFNTNDNPLDGLRLQVDYKYPIKNGLWESGYQYRLLNHPGDFIYLDRDFENNTWIENPLFTNSIDLNRKIHSVYSQLSGKQNKLEYNAGLRLEYFDRTVGIAQPQNTFTLDRLNLFPSFNIGYELADGFTLKVGYSKRIERTTTFKMTPFPEREHSETLEQGDAELLPEYIDLAELGIVKNWGDHSAFATIYYRHIDNVINRVNTVFNNSILNRIYTNAGDADALGLEYGFTTYPTDKMRFNFGGNVYNYKIVGELFGEEINTKSTIYSFNGNLNYNFSSSFDAQLAINYLSERITAQGEDSRFYNPSLTLRKSFLDKKVSVSFQWINMDLGLLQSNEQRITTYRDNFYTTTNYVYEVDILRLNFNYRINQSSNKTKFIESEFGKKEF